jgi:sulfide:quinone oxidoreductase
MDPAEAVMDEGKLLSEGVRWLPEKAEKIDVKNRKVKAGKREIEYDYLIISTGSRLYFSEMPELEKETYHFYSMVGALRLKDVLNRFAGGRVVIGIGGLPYKCPPAPLEMAFLLHDHFKRLGIRDKVQLTFLYPLPRVFPIQSVAEMAEPILDKIGVEKFLMFNLESIDPKKKELISLEGDTVKYDLAIIVPPHRGAEVVERSELGDEAGWIPTDRYTLNMKGYDDVYVIGDATDLPISKAGSVADFEASIVTSRIKDEIEGYTPRSRYDGKVMCFMVTGMGNGTTLLFDYEHPPRPTLPNFACYWLKLIYNKLYWNLTARALLPGVTV